MKPRIYPGIAPEDDTDIEVIYPEEPAATTGLWSEIKSITRDIIVFWFPDDPSKSFIKRIIGLPGETIDMDALGHITINGVPLDESYLAPERNQMARARWATVEQRWKAIKQHYYFVMGDNRDMSNDSRSWGWVPEKYIYGKAMFRYWPLQRMGSLDSTADYDPEQQ